MLCTFSSMQGKKVERRRAEERTALHRQSVTAVLAVSPVVAFSGQAVHAALQEDKRDWGLK